MNATSGMDTSQVDGTMISNPPMTAVTWMTASSPGGIVAVRSPQALPSAMSSKRSGRLTGSPPVKTMSGVPISAV